MTAWVSSVIAGAALLFAVGTYFIERRQRRADIAQERTDRANQLAEERKLRQAELDLLRQQVEISERRLESARGAHVTVEQRDSSGGATFDTYRFDVTNAGPAAARHIEIELQEAATGTPLASGVGPRILMAGKKGSASVELPREHRGKGIAIHVLWVDASSQQQWLESERRNSRDTKAALVHVADTP